jgi:hypothetical protein
VVTHDQAPMLIGSGVGSSVLRQASDATGPLLRIEAFQGFRMAHLRLERPNRDRLNTGIEAGPKPGVTQAEAGRWFEFDNVRLVGFETGMVARFLQKTTFNHIHAEFNKVGIVVTSATNGGAWRDCSAMFNEIGIHVIREADSGLEPFFHMMAGVIEANTKFGLVFDSVSHVLLENVYFERNGTNGTKAAEGDADGTCPIGAGIEVRQTIGQVDVVHHTYLRPFLDTRRIIIHRRPFASIPTPKPAMAAVIFVSLRSLTPGRPMSLGI